MHQIKTSYSFTVCICITAEDRDPQLEVQNDWQNIQYGGILKTLWKDTLEVCENTRHYGIIKTICP
jgi:hypothetical protein